MKVAINNTIIDQAKAVLPALSEGVLYGYGAFETIKLKDQKLSFFDEHWQRLEQACTQLKISLNHDADETKHTALTIARENGLSDGVIRIAVTKHGDSSDLMISSSKPRYQAGDYTKGFKVCFADATLMSSGPLVGLKHNNYLVNLITLQEAKGAGLNEAIFLNEKGHIAEGCVSNIFFVHKGTLLTPCKACGLLPGIMREQVITHAKNAGITVEETKISPELIKDCDEIFLTNSLMEIMPVCAFEENVFAIEGFKLTKQLQAALNSQ